VLMALAVILWLAAAVCLWRVLIDDAGAGYLVGYIVLQGLSIPASARARKRRIA
jgi:hypothetical protein